MTPRSRSTQRPLSKANLRAPKSAKITQSPGASGKESKGKPARGKSAKAAPTQRARGAKSGSPSSKAAPSRGKPKPLAKGGGSSAKTKATRTLRKAAATKPRKAKELRAKELPAKRVPAAAPARSLRKTQRDVKPSRSPGAKSRGRGPVKRARGAKNEPLVPIVDKRQLAFSFAASERSPEKTPERLHGPSAVAASELGREVQPEARPSKSPGQSLPPPEPVLCPVPVSLERLQAAVERETERRAAVAAAAAAAAEKAPDSTLRGLPIGVRRGRLMPRTERSDDAEPSSRSHNFDLLERCLAGSGVVADADALRGYLTPWLNGTDVLAFVPADRSALIGVGSVATANQKRLLIVLPTEENVADQVTMLKGAGIDARTFPADADDRRLVVRELAKTHALALVLSLEQLLLEDVVDDAKAIGLDLLAIDECQRVSELAPDFDPGLERLADLAPKLGRPPTLALLRAVPPSVRSDLPHRLGLRNPLRVDLSPVHDTLALDVITTDPGRRLALLCEQLRMSPLPACVLGYSMADVNEIHSTLTRAGFDARRLDSPVRPPPTDPSEQVVWVVSTGRVTSPLLHTHTLVHFRSPASLEQYCRDLGWLTHSSGSSRSVVLISPDDESLVKGTLERARPRAEDLAGLASVLVRHGNNASTVLVDSLCPAVGMNRARVESLIQIFARAGWVDHSQDWVRLRADCPDLVDRARGLGARLKTAKERDAQRLRSVSAYVISRGCRQESLRRHFGTAGSKPCGVCDACRTGRLAQPAPPPARPVDDGVSIAPIRRRLATPATDLTARIPRDPPEWHSSLEDDTAPSRD